MEDKYLNCVMDDYKEMCVNEGIKFNQDKFESYFDKLCDKTYELFMEVNPLIEELNKPKLKKEYGWYVAVKFSSDRYLRRDITVKQYAWEDGTNIGYWKTEKKAKKARKKYLKG